MRSILLVAAVALLATFAVHAHAASPAADAASLLIVNTKVFTTGAAHPQAQAVAIKHTLATASKGPCQHSANVNLGCPGWAGRPNFSDANLREILFTAGGRWLA